jgi:hypothetical protein
MLMKKILLLCLLLAACFSCDREDDEDIYIDVNLRNINITKRKLVSQEWMMDEVLRFLYIPSPDWTPPNEFFVRIHYLHFFDDGSFSWERSIRADYEGVVERGSVTYTGTYSLSASKGEVLIELSGSLSEIEGEIRSYLYEEAIHHYATLDEGDHLVTQDSGFILH